MKSAFNVSGVVVVAILATLTGCAGNQVKEAPPPVEVAPPAPEPREETVRFSGDALFAFGKSSIEDLTEVGRDALDALALRLNQAVRVDAVRVVGHTDRIGNAGYNKRLSLARAETVRDYLAAQGVMGSLIEVEGRGKDEPVEECPRLRGPALVECLAPNRRVEVSITAIEMR